MKNVPMFKTGDIYQLGDAQFRAEDKISLHPVVDKAGRELTDDIMRTLDVSYGEYADTAGIDRERFRAWWAGEPGAQLTARDVYEIDQLNGELIQGKIRQHWEDQQSQEQLRREAEARKQEQNAARQTAYDRSTMWDNILNNAGPAPKPQLDSYQQARIAELQELAKRPIENEHDQRERAELTKALHDAGF
jgi:hypothetical protein